MLKKLFVTFGCIILSQPALACVSVGPEPEIDYQFESDDQGSLKVIMNTAKGQSREKLQLQDDDGYLTTYLLAGYIKNNPQNFEQNGSRHYAAWGAQLQRLAEKMESPSYQDALIKQVTKKQTNPVPSEDAIDYVHAITTQVKRIAKSVLDKKTISQEHLDLFNKATADLGGILSYPVQKKSGDSLTHVQAKEFKVSDLPGAVTGVKTRGLGCAAGKVTNFGIVPLKSSQSAIPQGFSTSGGTKSGT